MQPDSIHLVSQRPKIDKFYVVISAAICADLPASHMVLTFHVPNNVVALGVRGGGGVGIAASFRLSLRRVMRVPEETSSPAKTDVVSVCNLFVFTCWAIGPPSFTRAPLARRFQSSEQASMARGNKSSTILRPAQQSPTYLFPATTTWTRGWTFKNGRAAGPDGIPSEAIKADLSTSTKTLHELFGKIWERDEIPDDWKEGYLVKLPKKGGLKECENWRGVMLLSTAGKVPNRIILERLKAELDKRLRDEQAGFWKERSCTDQIATLRIIVKQSLEWNTPVYAIFVDYEKAFDSVDREVLRKLLRHYGTPEKYIILIQKTYEKFAYRVTHNGVLCEMIEMLTGVRQGYLLSPFLFLLVIDWIMRQTTEEYRDGIQWTFTTRQEDLDFADDFSLLSNNHQDMQSKLTRLAKISAKTGLRISKSKTKVMRIYTRKADKLALDGEAIDEVENFTYLGSNISKDGGSDQDIQVRIEKERTAFAILTPVWRSKVIARKTKLRIFNTNLKSVLLYGSETWRVTKSTSNKLQSFVNRCLRSIMGIHWLEVIRNEELWARAEQERIDIQIRRRKWGWIGRTLRKPTAMSPGMH